MKFSEIKIAAHGRWADILSGLGVEINRGHSPCPGCGGNDRFRFDDRTGNGDFYCNQMESKSGDGFNLLQHIYDYSPKEAFDAVANYLGLEESNFSPPIKKAQVVQLKPKSDYARKLWQNAEEGVSTHPYAISKGICFEAGARRGKASGRVVGKNADCLVIPVSDIQTGQLIGVQCINPEGKKQSFGQLRGGCLLLGNTLDKSLDWWVVEGWADAVSAVFHIHKGNAVAAVAFGMNRMMEVAEGLAVKYEPERIMTVEDAE